MRVQILRGPGRWCDVQPLWQEILALRAPTSHRQLPEWAAAVSATLDDDCTRWAVAHDEQGPLAVVPYKVRRRSHMRVPVRMLTHHSHLDAVVSPRCPKGALRPALLRASAEGGEPLHGTSLVALRRTADMWALAADDVEASVEAVHGGCSILDVSSDADQWFAAAGKNLRASVRKARNRAQRAGGERVEVATDPDRVAEAFEGYVTIEASGWKSDAGALVNRTVQRQGLQRFMIDAARSGQACTRSLFVGDRLAGAQLGCRVDDTFVLLKVAYEDDLAHLSPGNLLMADLVQACCDDPGIARIDLVTNQPWHQRWGATTEPTYQQRSFNLRTAPGVVGALAAAARRRLPLT